MKSLSLLFLVALMVSGGSALAQCNADENEIGIFWDLDPASCQNCLIYVGGSTTAYVVMSNPSRLDGVSGYEFSLVNADGAPFAPPAGSSIFSTGYVLPTSALNVSAAPEFVVGLASPIPWSEQILLLGINLLVFSPEEWCFGVTSTANPSIAGQMAYSDGLDPGLLVPMYPNNGQDAPDFGMACLNSPGCPDGPVAVEESNWGSLKSLYR